MPDKEHFKLGAAETARWIARFYRPFLHVVGVLLLLTPIQAVVDVVVPRMVGYTIDSLRGVATEDRFASIIPELGARYGLEAAPSFAVSFIVIGVVSFILYACLMSTRAWMNARLEWAFRQDAFNRMTEKGPDFYQKFRTGDLVTRLTDDVAEKLSWFACSGIFRTYEAITKIVLIVAMMISIDPLLTLFTAGPLPLLVFVFSKSGTLLDKRYATLQSRISSVNERMEACFSGIRVVMSYVKERAQQLKFGEVARERRAAEISTVRVMAVIESLWNSVWQFGAVVVIFAGGWRVIQGGVSIGDLASFLYYTIWLVFPMFDLGMFVVKSRQSAISIGRLAELEQVPASVVGGNGNGRPLAENSAHSVHFRGVDYRFAGSERPALRDVDIKIGAGETVAIAGRVGCGKSSVVNLLPRLVDPTGGHVEIDGIDTRELPLEELRGAIGFVPQDPVLFSDTVRNNVLFGRDDISEETLQWAIEVAQFRDDVDGFIDGEETRIGTRGVALSGGQKQRLALARALAGKPKILVLDDCTSALDSSTETALWRRLHEVMPDLTAVLITHRPDTLRRADRIYVLSSGKVVECGTHDELIASGGEYSAIYRRYELEEMVG